MPMKGQTGMPRPAAPDETTWVSAAPAPSATVRTCAVASPEATSERSEVKAVVVRVSFTELPERRARASDPLPFDEPLPERLMEPEPFFSEPFFSSASSLFVSSFLDSSSFLGSSFFSAFTHLAYSVMSAVTGAEKSHALVQAASAYQPAKA